MNVLFGRMGLMSLKKEKIKNKKDYDVEKLKIEVKTIKKLRIVKMVGFLIILIIVLIQIFRIVYFDFTAVSIVKTVG